MPKRIEFEGKTHEFPDDFNDQDIAHALGGSTPMGAPGGTPGLLQAPGAPMHNPAPSNEPRLPADLGEKAMKLGVRSLPYVGATAAGILAPEITVPGILGTLGTAALGTAFAGAGAGIGSLAERGASKLMDLPQPETSLGEDVVQKGVLPELGGRAVTGVLGKLFSRVRPGSLYQSALKPTGKLPEIEKDIQTGLREGIVPGEQAPEMVRQKFNQIHNQIEGIINASPTNIPPQQWVGNIQKKLDTLRSQWGKDPINGAKFVQQIDDMERNMLVRHGNVQPIQQTVQRPGPVLGPNGKPTMVNSTVTIDPADMSLPELRANAQALPASNAQGIKKAAYETIRSNRGQTAFEAGTHPGLTTEVENQIASSLRQDIASMYPGSGIEKLSAQDSAMRSLEEQLQRWVTREGRKQILPYFVFPAAGAAFGFGAHGAEGAGAGAGFGMLAGHLLRSALEDPAVKARLAIAMYRAAKVPAAKAAGKALSVSLPADLRIGQQALQREPGQ